MDRRLSIEEISKPTFFKQFEYLDLIPYSIAILMIAGGVYIFESFLIISHQLIQFAK